MLGGGNHALISLQNYAAIKNMEYLETSSKDDYQIEKAFEMLAEKILQS